MHLRYVSGFRLPANGHFFDNRLSDNSRWVARGHVMVHTCMSSGQRYSTSGVIWIF